MYSDDQDWEPPSEADLKLIAARRERADQISKLMAGYLLKGYKMLGILCQRCDTILLQDRQGINICVACTELDSDTDKDNPVINESAAISMARELERSSAAGSTSPSATANRVSGASSSSPTSANTEADVQRLGGLASTASNSNMSLTHQDCKPKVSVENVASNLSVSSIDVQSFTTNITSSAKDRNSPRQPTALSKPISEDSSDSGFVSTHSRLEDKKASDIFCIDSGSDTIHVSRIKNKINWASKELDNTPSLEYSIQLCTLIKTASEAIVALRNARV